MSDEVYTDPMQEYKNNEAIVDLAQSLFQGGLPEGYTIELKRLEPVRPNGGTPAIEKFANVKEAIHAGIASEGFGRVAIGLNAAPDQGRPFKGEDFSRINNLLIDVDAKHPKGVCANDEEHEATQEAATAINRRLARFYFPEPIIIDTGNGTSLIYSCDLPAKEGQEYHKKLLEYLQVELFKDNPFAKIDLSTTRLIDSIRIPGTWNRSHEERLEEGRVWRKVQIISCPDAVTEGRLPIELRQLQKVLGEIEFKPAGDDIGLPQYVTREKTDLIYAFAQAAGFQKIERISNGVRCCCPLHDDRNPSFLFTLGKKEGDDACYTCLSDSCGHSGSIKSLMQYIGFNADDHIKRAVTQIFAEGFNVIWFAKTSEEVEQKKEPVDQRLLEIEKKFGVKLPDTISLGDLKSIKRSVEDWLIKDRVDRATIMAIYGDSGVGKSSLLLNLMLSLANGWPIFDSYESGKPKKVLYFQAEDGIDTIDRRIDALPTPYTQSKKELLRNVIVPKSGRGDNIQWSGALCDSKGNDTDEMRIVKGLIKYHNADVVVFDTLTNISSEDLDKTSDTTRLMNALLKLCSQFGVNVIFVHHTNKTAKKDLANSYKIKASCRACLLVAEDNNVPGGLTLSWEKLNSGPKGESIKAHREGDRIVFDVDNPLLQQKMLRDGLVEIIKNGENADLNNFSPLNNSQLRDKVKIAIGDRKFYHSVKDGDLTSLFRTAVTAQWFKEESIPGRRGKFYFPYDDVAITSCDCVPMSEEDYFSMEFDVDDSL